MKPHTILASYTTRSRTKQFIEMQRFQVFQGLSGQFVYLNRHISAPHVYLDCQDAHTQVKHLGVVHHTSACRPIFPTLVIL